MSDAWDGPGLPFAGCLIMLALDTVLYMLLALYCDAVLPSERLMHFKMFSLKEIMTPFFNFQVFKKSWIFFKDLEIRKWRHYFLQSKHFEIHFFFAFAIFFW